MATFELHELLPSTFLPSVYGVDRASAARAHKCYRSPKCLLNVRGLLFCLFGTMPLTFRAVPVLPLVVLSNAQSASLGGAPHQGNHNQKKDFRYWMNDHCVFLYCLPCAAFLCDLLLLFVLLRMEVEVSHLHAQTLVDEKDDDRNRNTLMCTGSILFMGESLLVALRSVIRQFLRVTILSSLP